LANGLFQKETTHMSYDLATVLPNIANSLNGTGFLFGAGTSCEAGYPMMPALTRQVVSALTSAQRALLDEVLAAAGATYDAALATPNIEQLSDLVIAHLINSSDPRFNELEQRFRELIIESILSISTPNIDNHCVFFENLRKRAFGLPCCIWIFTTNYDLLFETAASRCGVILENGFSGATERFFDPARFNCTTGTVTSGRFSPNSGLTVKLIKLHGSVSWAEDATKFYERHPAAITSPARRTMILPRRRKVMDTLIPPFDALFTQATRVLGGECKYVASCGFSYGDEHINKNLLLGAMRNNKCRLFAFSKEEPDGITDLKALPNFGAAFETHSHRNGVKISETTDAWKFSKFAELFA
jgi:hypothetical protein